MEKIKSTSDNVTNTSAAMEELAASMENVASTTGTLTDNLEAVREATKAIDAEAIEGAEKANQIKDEADLIKREANSKKESTFISYVSKWIDKYLLVQSVYVGLHITGQLLEGSGESSNLIVFVIV